MRLSIVPAAGLSAGQLAAVTARIDAAEHRHDHGACLFWHRDGALAKCYVALLPDTGTPVGIAYVDGGSATCAPRGGSIRATAAPAWDRS